MGFVNEYRIRYGECDQQGVVFNSWYLLYMDDTVDVWLRELDMEFEGRGWEVMLKRSEITWHGSARHNQMLRVDCEASRLGNSSFDVTFEGRVDDQPCFEAITTYVVVDTSAHRPKTIPDDLRAHLGS